MSNNSEEIEFKLITLGDSGVGKTSIIKRYAFNIFDENSLTTVGINYVRKDVTIKSKKKNIKIKLKLIDTAGQEKYKAITTTYFKNADGVFFVYSLEDELTFTNMKEWIKLFRENNGKSDIPKFLIGNKSDLNKDYDSETIDEFIKNNFISKFYMTSALDKTNIDEAVQKIVEEMYDNYIKNERNKKQKNIELKENKKKGNCLGCKADN